MNILERIITRLKKEGPATTIKYAVYALPYGLREFYYNTFLDIWYSGRILKGNKRSAYRHLGANDTYHTSYSVMPLIFKMVPISKNDVLVDVGCGKGRVINYWLSWRLKNKIIGLELDPAIARQTDAQFAKRKNVEIIPGDAVSNIPADGTVFYFYNPFCEEKVRQFEKKLSRMLSDRPVRIIYYNPKSIHVFQNGKWDIRSIDFERDLGKKRWDRINNFHKLAIITLLPPGNRNQAVCRRPDVHGDKAKKMVWAKAEVNIRRR